jgi:FtsP/CotA-like multicopper oxidase with cupredoxin domain
VPLVIQDRSFDGDNQLVYGGQGMMDTDDGFFGNRVLVNGHAGFLPWPSRSRTYRLRLLNGSNHAFTSWGGETAPR